MNRPLNLRIEERERPLKPLDRCDDCEGDLWRIADGMVLVRSVRGRLLPFLVHHFAASPRGQRVRKRGAIACYGSGAVSIGFLHLFLRPGKWTRQLHALRKSAPSGAQPKWDTLFSRLDALAAAG